MSSILKGKSILVTGGTGSIGETIVKRALREGANKIRVFSNDENGLYEMEQQFDGKNLEYVIGDIRDEDIVESLVKKIDIVFHAAALKHVDRCELNPFEAITVNTIGTKNLIKAALKERVSKVVTISTDKAVNPIGVMGATKLLAEKLMSAEAYRHNNSGTIFTTVRFGNVIQTRGSILPKIERQIKSGGPITLTDDRMMRFFMTREEAVDLILNAAKLAKGGETFVLKMPLIRLKDLFDVMNEILAPKYGHKPSQIRTKIIGIRPGEKLVEYLLNDYEMEIALETKEFFIIPPLSDMKGAYPGAKKPANLRSYFDNMKPTSKGSILKMLKQVY
jgi:UDP-N-acetylglucosamine 4,6-dehydratase